MGKSGGWHSDTEVCQDVQCFRGDAHATHSDTEGCPSCASRFPGRYLNGCTDDWHDPNGDAGGWSGATLGSDRMSGARSGSDRTGRPVMSTVWREPDEESIDLYPGLVVHDGRVSGSITTGASRLPLWAFVGVIPEHGWAEAQSGWDPEEYGWDARRVGEFLYYLLEPRGEFARLLLMLANAEREDADREDTALEGHGPVVRIKTFDGDPPDAVELPPPWWLTPGLREPILEQLRRCIGVLEAEA